MTNKKHAIMHVAIIDETGQITGYDTLETLRGIYDADVYDYTAGDTKALESWYDEDEADYLERVTAELAKQRETIIYDPNADLAFMTEGSFDWWTHYLRHVGRYATVDQTIYRGESSDEYTELYDTLEEAAEDAQATWRRKSPYDQARARVYVASGLEDMHEGYEILDSSRGGFDSAVDEIYRRESI